MREAALKQSYESCISYIPPQQHLSPYTHTHTHTHTHTCIHIIYYVYIIYQQLGGERKTDKETDGKMGVEPAFAPRLLKSSSGCCSKISRSRRNGPPNHTSAAP